MRANWVLGLAVVLVSAAARADESGDQYAVAAGHYARGQWKFAAEEFQSFLDGYPDHAKFDVGLFFLAEALLQMKDYDRAGPRFLEYIERRPDGELARPALFRAGESAYLAGELARAETRLNDFSARYPEDELNAYALGYLGNIAVSEGDATAAVEHFRRALKRFPQGPLEDECRLGLGRAMEKQGNTERARRYYLALAAKAASPLADDAQFHLGSLQYAAGDFEEAIAAFGVFDSRLSGSPLRPSARMGHGWALLKLDRLAEAESCFRRIISDSEGAIEARYWLGLTQKTQSQWEAAAATFLEAIAVDPDHDLLPALQVHAGDALARAGHTAAACQQFDRVIEAAGPDSPWLDDAVRGRMQAALQTKDTETLERLAEEFSRRFAESPLGTDVRRMLARSLIDRKEYARAEEVLDRLIAAGRSDQEKLEDRYLRSLAATGLEQYEDALTGLSGVLNSATGRLLGDAKLARATALIGLKRFGEAVAPLKEFLATHPAPDAAAKGLAQLAVCFARTGRLDEAKLLYAQLRAEHPGHDLIAPATEQLAEAAYDSGDSSWCLRLFTWLSTRSGSAEYELKGLSGLGWTQFEAGRLDEAAETFERLLAKDPDDATAAEATLARGRILQQLDRPDAALAMYDLIVRRYGQSEQFPEAVWAAARISVDLGRNEKAAELYRTLAEAQPRFSQIDTVLYEWAWVLDDLGQSDASRELFERLHQEHARSSYWADATFRLAQRAFDAQDYGRSGQLLAALLSAGPDALIRESSFYLKGQIAAAEGKWQESRQSYETLLADYPQSPLRPMAEYGVAEALFRQADYRAAAERLRRVADQTQESEAPWLAGVHLRLAQTLAHEKKWEDAYAEASEIEAKYPGFAQQYEADYLLGRCLATRADFEGARAAYRKVITSPGGAKTETAAKAQLMIAESHFHQEDYKAALRNYLRMEILYGYPDLQAAAMLQAAKCHELLGQPQPAVDLYVELLEKYPQTGSVAEAAARLRNAKERLADRSE